MTQSEEPLLAGCPRLSGPYPPAVSVLSRCCLWLTVLGLSVLLSGPVFQAQKQDGGSAGLQGPTWAVGTAVARPVLVLSSSPGHVPPATVSLQNRDVTGDGSTWGI